MTLGISSLTGTSSLLSYLYQAMGLGSTTGTTTSTNTGYSYYPNYYSNTGYNNNYYNTSYSSQSMMSYYFQYMMQILQQLLLSLFTGNTSTTTTTTTTPTTIFDAIDANNDSNLSENEMVNSLYTTNNQYVANFINNFVERDSTTGYAKANQLFSYVAGTDSLLSEADIQKIDTNSDGTLSSTELFNTKKAMYDAEIVGSRAAAKKTTWTTAELTKYDLNGDKKVNWADELLVYQKAYKNGIGYCIPNTTTLIVNNTAAAQQALAPNYTG